MRWSERWLGMVGAACIVVSGLFFVASAVSPALAQGQSKTRYPCCVDAYPISPNPPPNADWSCNPWLGAGMCSQSDICTGPMYQKAVNGKCPVRATTRPQYACVLNAATIPITVNSGYFDCWAWDTIETCFCSWYQDARPRQLIVNTPTCDGSGC